MGIERGGGSGGLSQGKCRDEMDECAGQQLEYLLCYHAEKGEGQKEP